MKKNKVYCHSILLYFQKIKNAIQTTRKICAIYRDKLLQNPPVGNNLLNLRLVLSISMIEEDEIKTLISRKHSQNIVCKSIYRS